jgi:hypothetical protein
MLGLLPRGTCTREQLHERWVMHERSHFADARTEKRAAIRCSPAWRGSTLRSCTSQK